jgi:hypothetical protein
LAIFLLLQVGCNHSDFSPMGEFQNKLVVSCVLDNRSNILFAKVQNTFLLENSQNLSSKKLLKNIKLTLSESNNSYNFLDTLIPSLNNYDVFYIPGFIPKRGQQYILTTSADGYSPVNSVIKVPADSYISVAFSYTLNEITTQISSNKAKGFSFHMYIEYEIIQNNTSRKSRVEVPLVISGSSSDVITYSNLGTANSRTIPFDNFIYALTSISPGMDQKIKVNKGYVLIYSLEENMYNYYVSVNGFNDPYSIRLDQPFYSNISQGYGLFGSVVLDSARYVIPFGFLEPFDYIDGQN